MPLFDWRCPTGHIFEAYQPSDRLDSTMACLQCKAMADKVFLKAPLGFVRGDVHYESPLDGRPITSYQAHVNELARGDCVEYEPGIKQDGERKRRESEESLERAVDETVERAIAAMPARKLEKLTAELEGGLTAEPARVTPHQKSFREAA